MKEFHSTVFVVYKYLRKKDGRVPRRNIAHGRQSLFIETESDGTDDEISFNFKEDFTKWMKKVLMANTEKNRNHLTVEEEAGMEEEHERFNDVEEEAENNKS